MTDRITVKGLNQVLAKINRIKSPAVRKRVLSAGAFQAQELIAVYPKSTIANSPANPTGRWYERGFGTRTATGKAYATSETLGRRWTTRVTANQAVVGNNASYARFVQGDKQAALHKRRGWVSTRDVAEKPENVRKIVRAMDDQMAREVASA